MDSLGSLNAITRRALRVNYISPAVCVNFSGVPPYGSGSGVPSTLNFDPIFRKAGPVTLTATKIGNTVLLNWSAQPYIFSYFVYMSTNPNGPFTILINGTHLLTFTTLPLSPGAYYFKVTGIEPDAGETLPSPTIGPITI